MNTCDGDHSELASDGSDLDYLFAKCSWCVNNNCCDCTRLCRYVERITQLSADSLSLDHLFHANNLIEYLAENFSTEPKYVYYLKSMLVLCLMPPTVKTSIECSTNLSILVRFYNVMAKCMWSVRAHPELSALLYGVVNTSVLRRHRVPANSVGLSHCHKAVETGDLPGTLMWMIGSHTTISQTTLDDLLKLSYNVAVVSDRSALRMMQSHGVQALIDTLSPNFLWASENSCGRSTAREFVIMLLDLMFCLPHEMRAAAELPPIVRHTLEILFVNIKIEMERNNPGSIKTRNDFCRVLGEVISKCSVDENEFSNEMITDTVMLCVWPENVLPSHWLRNVRFEFSHENFVLKNIMLDVTSKVFATLLPRKTEFQQLNTLLIRDFVAFVSSSSLSSDVERATVDRMLVCLPRFLCDSADGPVKHDCCVELLALIESLRQRCGRESRDNTTMVNAIVAAAFSSACDDDVLRTFKSLGADVIINSVVLDSLDAGDSVAVRDIRLYGLNALNVFFRRYEAVGNDDSEIQRMVFGTVIRVVELCCASGDKSDQNVLLDSVYFIGTAVARFDDLAEMFVGAGGVELLLNVLPSAKYPIQLEILTTLVDLAVSQLAKCRIKKWRSTDSDKNYLEVMCDIWRYEKVRFDFLDDDGFVFRGQRDGSAGSNLSVGRRPVVESVYARAQSKVHTLLRLVDGDGVARARSLVRQPEDKVTATHVYHYGTLKLAEIWYENAALCSHGQPSLFEARSMDAVTAWRARLVDLIKAVGAQLAAGLDAVDDSAEIQLENELYEEIRRYHLNILSE